MGLIQQGISYIREIIGGPQRKVDSVLNTPSTLKPTYDVGRGDYAFWDRARHGKAPGLGLAGLFLKPLESKIAAQVMSRVPTIKYERQAQTDFIENWQKQWYPALIDVYKNSIGLGDYFVVVNPDSSLTAVPPDVVKPVLSNDLRRVIGWQIRETYSDPYRPGRTQTHIDTYTATLRTHEALENGVTVSKQTFPNLLGRIPVVHVAFGRTASERFGRAVGDALLHLLQRYNEILEAGLDGNKRQGRPTPVISGMGTQQDIDAFWDKHASTHTRVTTEGEIVERILPWTGDKLQTLGGTAEFDWKSPGSFAGDTEKLLGLLFYLVVQHTEIPEYVWGTALNGSKASAETQQDPYILFTEMHRTMVEPWLMEVYSLALGYEALSDVSLRKNVFSSKGEAERPMVEWPSLTPENGELRLKSLEFGKEAKVLDRETIARNLPTIKLDDVKGTLKKVDEEDAAAQDAEDQRVDRRIDRLANAPPDDEVDLKAAS